MPRYVECPFCHAHNDPGEICECQQGREQAEETETKQKKKEAKPA